MATPSRRVRFRGTELVPQTLKRPHVIVLAACILLLVGSVNYLFSLRHSDAWWSEYDDDDSGAGGGGAGDSSGGGGGSGRDLPKATGIDGELDAAYRHAARDKRFLRDQHHHAAAGAAAAGAAAAGGGAASGGGTASGRYGSELAGAQDQQQRQHFGHQRAGGQQQQQGGGAGAVGGGNGGAAQQEQRQRLPVLVSYAYHEAGVVEKANFEYFLIMAMGIDSRLPQPSDTDFAVGVLGQACEPCAALLPDVKPRDAPPAHLPYYDQVKASDYLTLVFRFEAAGGALAGHNATLEWAGRTGRLRQYSHVIFVSSAARGPFVPSYLPPGWQWTDAFTSQLGGGSGSGSSGTVVRGVGAALACANKGAPGGPGPRLSQWAFALDREGLRAVMDAGVFALQPCSACEDGVEAAPDGAVSRALLARGHNLGTLLAMYGPSLDWRDRRHWACNDYVSPDLHGSYEGIDMHPFEALFVRATAHTGEPYLSRYSRWFMQRALGRQATHGRADPAKASFFDTSARAAPVLRPPDMGACFPWLKHWHPHQHHHGHLHAAN